MGCNNAKMVQVGPNAMTQRSISTKANSEETIDKELLAGTDRFATSASSKGSNRSGDSGCFEDDINEYAGIITEDSEIADKVERDFIPNEALDLSLDGVPAPRNLSAKDKARLDEQRILENLRNEGLIATSKFQTKSGLAFDVVAAQPDQHMLRRALPARLAKLDPGKKKSKELTKEQIEEKLARAEERKKAKEQARLRKMHRAVNHHQEIQESQQEEHVQHQKELREQTLEKVDAAATNREIQLQEKIAKQKAREERAAKVRLRKKLHIPTQEELDEIEARHFAEQQLLTDAKTEPLKRGEDCPTATVELIPDNESSDDGKNGLDQPSESKDLTEIKTNAVPGTTGNETTPLEESIDNSNVLPVGLNE